MDAKDYDEASERVYRPSVRGVILDEKNRMAMIYSRKYHFYKFPGGGIEENETRIEALAREIKEETGLSLIPDSAKEFGEVLRVQKGKEPGKVFMQENYYYTCKVADEVGEQNLSEHEKESDFVLAFVPVDTAIAANAALDSDQWTMSVAERERRVLEVVKTEWGL